MRRIAVPIAALLSIARPAAAFGCVQEEAASPSAQFETLRAEYDRVSSSGVPHTDEERTKLVGAVFRRRNELALRFLELARRYPDDPIALDALIQAVWQVNTTPWPVDVAGEDTARAEALAWIVRDHVSSDRLGPLCQRVAYGYCSEYETFLRAVLTKNPDRIVQATAAVSLATFLDHRSHWVDLCRDRTELAAQFASLYGAEYFAELQKQERDAVAKDAAAAFERAIELGGDARLPDGAAISERAKAGLFELQHLNVGQEAPELEGEDQDGRRLQLSEYRGKVVLLDFWSYV